MRGVIHARVVDGHYFFRVYNNITDAYMTDPMDEAALIQYLRRVAIEDAILDVARNAPDRIARAKRIGTSSQIGDERDVDGPWDPPLQDTVVDEDALEDD